MSTTKLILLVLILTANFVSCKTDVRFKYAIRDFKISLQTSLTHIVSKGIVDNDTSVNFLRTHATNQELLNLCQSEHPLLRAVAFRLLLERPDIDHFHLLMNHLDDTSTIAKDAGEWGIKYSTVSDDIIGHSNWKDVQEKNKTIYKVIFEHSYLKSAYNILYKLEPEDKYYKYIKKMAQEDRDFNDIEYALFGLAKYKKPEDIEIIKISLRQIS